ncbi:processive diacylglycerol beta-glucosyltransferase [Clostridium acetireducens DSM 10703]|jgi:processive 1,2-diacylglycerol beta-glucosyltransferase|uniref:Processive diacylglycerol beta-glucosyltransferase n=1 Tax=Clostridium acetireducens DSM 10703 TaxID=1121290 RepID=A0A1E8EZ78_9CLOT|nr:glycosyltransferase [Clostridium acetireducens]OFI06185.1 processive diacylglycerol beta-glucosyltransferase [Clostridium acetireducens DSM 10703]
MRVLILSVSAGGGHSHAAEAIKSYIKIYDKNSQVKIIDTLKYINPIIDKVVIGGYLKTIKITPSLFGKLYNYSENDFALSSLSAKINEMLAYKLLPLIKKFKPEILITTHPFTTEMLSILKRKYKVDLPGMSIITDYTPHSFWLHQNIDAYIVANSDMIDEMVLKGIPKKNIHPLGIPVNPKFMNKHNKKYTLEQLNLKENVTTLLIMGGSLGIGKISDVYKELIKVNKNIQIIAITGNNKKLYYELLNLQKTSNKKTSIIGYTNEVNKYMQACDLLLTKPGGLTITEALICNIPLALFSPIPGQEEKNAEFLLKHNLAIKLKNIKDCRETIEKLLSSPNTLKTMRDNCSKFSKPYCGNNIYNLINSLVIKYKVKNKVNNKIKNVENEYINNKKISTNFLKSMEKYFLKKSEKLL